MECKHLYFMNVSPSSSCGQGVGSELTLIPDAVQRPCEYVKSESKSSSKLELFLLQLFFMFQLK